MNGVVQLEELHVVTYHLKSSLDRAIDQYKTNLKNNIKLKESDKSDWERFIQNERGKVKIVADLQHKLALYR